MAGQVFVLMAFVAVVLGTLGNVKGALVASLMMGVAELLGIQFVGADLGVDSGSLPDAAADAGIAAKRPGRRRGAIMRKSHTSGLVWLARSRSFWSCCHW